MIFSNVTENHKVLSASTPVMETVKSEVKSEVVGVGSRKRKFRSPLSDSKLEQMSNKIFSEDTMKKVKWVVTMYRAWREYRNGCDDLESVQCDLDNKETITKEALISAVTRFITEVKKIDGSDYPAKTLYEIIICLQFHLETIGFAWRLLSAEPFKDIKFTLDNVMKMRTAEGVGSKVKQAEFLLLLMRSICGQLVYFACQTQSHYWPLWCL